MSQMKHSITYLSLLVCLFVSCAGPQTEREVIRSLDDLKGKTVAVLGGSVQDLYVSNTCTESRILRTEAASDTYAMIEKGKASAMMDSGISWDAAKKDFKNIFQVVGDIDPQPIGLGFNKSDTELRERFNLFLKKYLAENDMDAINDEWSDPDGKRQMPDPDDVVDPEGTLTFAVSAIIPPFNFIRNGEIVGSESELLARFAMSEGKRWEFMNVAFSGLINCIQSGKADIGASIMSITEERQKSIDFSIPWTMEPTVLLVNRKYAPEELLAAEDDKGETFWQSVKESFDKTLIKEDRYKMLLGGLDTTVLISLLAALFGTILGMLLCFGSMHRSKLLSKSSNFFIEFMRCMPQVVFLMIMFYVIFGKSDIDGIWVSVIAFSLCFAAYTSVIFRTAVQSIDKGQTEAALSMGFGKVKAFVNVVLPQAVQRALPVFKGEFIGLVKATSIVGYIAVFDVTKAGDVIRSRTYDAFFPLIIVTILYFLVIWLLTALLKLVENKTQPKRKKFFK